MAKFVENIVPLGRYLFFLLWAHHVGRRKFLQPAIGPAGVDDDPGSDEATRIAILGRDSRIDIARREISQYFGLGGGIAARRDRPKYILEIGWIDVFVNDDKEPSQGERGPHPERDGRCLTSVTFVVLLDGDDCGERAMLPNAAHAGNATLFQRGPDGSRRQRNAEVIHSRHWFKRRISLDNRI